MTDLTDKTRREYGVDDFVTAGVVVSNVQAGTAADQKGLMRGDVIEIACVQRGTLKTLGNSADYDGVTKDLKADQPVVLLVHHGKLSGQEDRSSTFLYLAPESK